MPQTGQGVVMRFCSLSAQAALRHTFDQSATQGASMHDNARSFDRAKKWRLSQHLEPLVRFVGPLSYMAAVPILYRLHPLAPLVLVVVLPVALFAAETMPCARSDQSRSEGIFLNRLAVWLT